MRSTPLFSVMFAGLLVATIGLFATSSLAATYHVSPTGDNAANGSASTPWKTLQHAANTIAAGDTVIVRAGDYAGFNMPTGGTSAARVTFSGEAGANITAPLSFSGNLYGINASRKSYITIEGLTFTPGASDAEWYSCIRIGGFPDEWAQGNIVRNNTCNMRQVGISPNPDKYGIYSSWQDGIIVENNTVSGTYNSLIYITQSSKNYLVRKNHVYNGGGNGIHNNADSIPPGIIYNAVIAENTIHNVGFGIGGQAISCDGVQDSRIENNLIYEAHSKGISLYATNALEGSKRDLVINNTVLVTQNAYVPMRINEYSSENTLRNNIFYAPTPSGAWIDIEEASADGMISDYNVTSPVAMVGGSPRNDWGSTYGFDLHSLISTPLALFVNAAANDYHLKSGSPAIDAGNPAQAPSNDIEQNPRPDGIQFDVGAFEYQSSPLDSDNDGLSDIQEAIYGTDPLNPDTDGDNVLDGKEVQQTTHPLDYGSFVLPKGNLLCSDWNGFLGGMWNIIEHVNLSTTTRPFETTIFDIDGAPQDTVSASILSGAQTDILVHDMNGWKRDSYGRVCSIHGGAENDVDGRMTYYKPGRSGEFEFAFSLPFSNTLNNSQFVLFNTYQPSLDPSDVDNLVANWVQLTNLSGSPQTGSLIYYAQNGSILAVDSSVFLAAGARRDFSGHQFGPRLVGMIEWRPDNSAGRFQLRVARYYYDNPGGIDRFDSAFQLDGRRGNGEPLVVPLDTRAGTAVLELANTRSTLQAISVKFFDKTGVVVFSQNIYLPG